MFYKTFICLYVSEAKPLRFSLCPRMFDDVKRCWIYNMQIVCHANEQLSLCYFFLIYKTLRYRLARALCIFNCSFNPIRPGGGAQRPGWPNSQLTIRNLLLYDAETWWLLVFILKAHSDQIFSKINQSGLLLFRHRDVPKILKMKKFSSAWKLLKLTWGVNFGLRRTILDIKTRFSKLNPFSGGK